jgi:hypothetical protein
MRWFTPTNLLWLFGHLILLMIGILFLSADHLFSISKSLAEGIGGGLIATGIAGEVLFLYVRASDSLRTRIELFTNAGLLRIFPHRSVRMQEEYDYRLKRAKEIDILGFGQSSFRQDYSPQFKQFSVQATVRVLLIDPDFPTPDNSLAAIRDLEEGNSGGQICSDVASFIENVAKIPGLNHSRFKIRRFRTIPSVSLFRIDEVIFWGPYLIGEPSRNTPTLLIQHGFLYDKLKAHFDRVWSSNQLSSPVQF